MQDDSTIPNDQVESTPLDILLNAITGSKESYPYNQFQQSDFDADSLQLGELFKSGEVQAESSRKRARGDASTPPSERRPKAGKTVSAYSITASGPPAFGPNDRLLNPPPTLRVVGPLRDTLTRVALSTQDIPLAGSSPTTFASQTHRIPIAFDPRPTEPPSIPSGKGANRLAVRRKLREAAGKHGYGASLPWERSKTVDKERQVLTTGLTFPGLYVGEAIGKQKRFQLQLQISRFNQDGPSPVNDSTDADHDVSVSRPASESMGPSPSVDDITPADLENIGGSTAKHDSTATSIPPAVETDFSATTNSSADAAPWATLLSAPLSIVSKPSQRTALARNLAGCLTEDESFALSVRIHHQTVRTKYMVLENDETPRLASRTATWTPFQFEVIRRAKLWTPDEPKNGIPPPTVETAEQRCVLTFGSVVRIVDRTTGVRSDPVVLVRVEKREAVRGKDVGHPISELQRVAFVREEDGASSSFSGPNDARYYLSAPGARQGGGELLGHRLVPRKSAAVDTPPPDSDSTPATLEEAGQNQPLEHDKDEVDTPNLSISMQRKYKRTKQAALAKAALAEGEDATLNGLVWTKAEGGTKEISVVVKKKEVEKKWEYVEKVEDWMAWTITGVDCLSYGLFENTARESGNTLSIDPVPRLLGQPSLDLPSHTFDLVVHPFDQDDPLDIYIGNSGPMDMTVWRSTASKTNRMTGVETPAAQVDDSDSTAVLNGRIVTSAFPSDEPHLILIARLPPMSELNLVAHTRRPKPTTMDDLREAMARPADRAEPSGAAEGIAPLSEDLVPQAQFGLSDDGIDASPWVSSEHPPVDSGELTIQEALRNAEDALNSDMNLDSFTPDMVGTPPTTFDLPGGRPEELRQAAVETSDQATKLEDGTLAMHRASNRRSDEEEDQIRLPITLVRRSDGVGFTTGYSLALDGRGRDQDALLSIVPDIR